MKQMINERSISIIIPTYNAEKYLIRLLKTIQQQSIGEYELIIIDSSSHDRTVELSKQFTENVVVIPQHEFDHGGTRTKAAKFANGDILIFLTQDALPVNEHTFEKILLAFDNPKVGAAYGRQISYPETNLFGKHLREFNYKNDSYVWSLDDKKKYGIKTAFLSDSFAAYRKSALESIGWFKDGLIVGEDTYAGAKILLASYELAYVSEAQVFHSHNYSNIDEFKRYFDIGVFHSSEKWILEEFGRAEGEGMKYIFSEFNYILTNKSLYLLPEFFVRNCMKYIGYKLGRNYVLLPKWIIKHISMHHNWWKKSKQGIIK